MRRVVIKYYIIVVILFQASLSSKLRRKHNEFAPYEEYPRNSQISSFKHNVKSDYASCLKEAFQICNAPRTRAFAWTLGARVVLIITRESLRLYILNFILLCTLREELYIYFLTFTLTISCSRCDTLRVTFRYT